MCIKVFSPQQWILIGIPIIIILATLFHFTYDWSGKSTLVGIFTPVNESIWEHLKLAVYPTILWWLLGYLILNRNTPINLTNWFVGCTISIIISCITIVTFYYTYTGALGFHSLVLDIFSLILGVFIGQCFALYIYNNCIIANSQFYLCLFAMLLIIFSFTLFTFATPKLPIFKDSITGTYGIY